MIQYSANTLHYPVTWSIKREPVYRLIENIDYLENFFSQGQLMVSCLENFKKNPDEMRGDSEEGRAMISEFGNGEMNKHIVYEGGKNGYILCTTKEITEKVIKDFNAVGAIKINNPMQFGLEIAKKLPFVNSAIEGACDYEDSRVKFLEGEYGKILHNLDFKNPEDEYLFHKITQGVELFLKNTKYKHQQEYRLIWFSKIEVNSSQLVKCPEALQFCEKITF